MFNLFKAKEIDTDLLKHNVSQAVISVWADSNTLKIEKFNSLRRVAESLNHDNRLIAKFFTEKLRLATSAMIISLSKAGIGNEDIDDIIEMIKSEIRKMDTSEIKGVEAALGMKAKEYAQQRFSSNPKLAGKQVESRFSQEVFGYVPSEDNVDARYSLYKNLSSFERSSIFAISSAIRNSRV